MRLSEDAVKERMELSSKEIKCLECDSDMVWAGDGHCHFNCRCGEQRYFCPFPEYHVNKGHDIMEHVECILREDGNYHCPICGCKTTHFVGCPRCGRPTELNGFEIRCPVCGPMGRLELKCGDGR